MRVALQDVVVDGGPVRLGSVLTDALAVELRKLDGVVVASMAEVRALLEQEAARQLVGCARESCLAEIADALGADVVFSVSVARIGQENVVAARTIDATTGQAKTTSHRVPAGTGEEVLALVGPVVAEVFPDVPLRANAVRGVATERARALNPPPLPTSVFWSAAGVAAAGLVSAASLGAGAAAVSSDLERKLAQSVEVPVSGRDIQSEHELGNGLASAAVVAASVGVGLGLGAVVVALFTDFEGYGDAQ